MATRNAPTSAPSTVSRTDVDADVVAQRGEVVGEHAVVRRESALLGGIPHERAHDRQPVPGRALDLVGALGQHPRDGRADRAVAEKAYADVNGRHAVSSTLSAICTAFSAAPLLRLSQARNRTSPFSPARSRRTRPTSTSSVSVRRGRRRRVDQTHRRSIPQQLLCLLGRELVLELDPDGLGVADEHGHAHRGGAERQLRQLEHLLRLGADLRLLVRLVVLPLPVEADVVLLDRLAPQLLRRARLPCPRRPGRWRRAPCGARPRRAAA